MSIEGQGHFFTIYFQGFVCFVLFKATISSERLQDHWSSGLITYDGQESLMLHTKFRRNWSTGTGVLKVFYHIWA